MTTQARTNLQAHAEHARGAFAFNTERALKADVAIFLAWCRAADMVPMPAAPDTVARFIDAMGEERCPFGKFLVTQMAATGTEMGVSNGPTEGHPPKNSTTLDNRNYRAWIDLHSVARPAQSAGQLLRAVRLTRDPRGHQPHRPNCAEGGDRRLRLPPYKATRGAFRPSLVPKGSSPSLSAN